MTNTDWYLVSFDVEYTESRLFLSGASLLKGKKNRTTISMCQHLLFKVFLLVSERK